MLNYQGNLNMTKFSTLNTINSTLNPASEILLRIYQWNVNVKLSRKFKYEIIKEM